MPWLVVAVLADCVILAGDAQALQLAVSISGLLLWPWPVVGE